MISIRPGSAGDREALFALVSRIGNFNREEQELACEVIGEALASDTSGYSLLVALGPRDQLAGFICYGPIPITEKRWDIYWIAVDPQGARKGIGSKLLQAMETALGQGQRIYIDTSSTPGYDSARNFYERHGYLVACLLPDFYRDGDHKIVFCKVL
jgi:ribosomal protein S18 acetylase RimI-like enzyme